MSNTDSASLMQQQNPAPEFGREGMELHEVVTLLWNSKWLIAGFVAAFLALSIVYAIRARPVYRANAMLQIQQQRSALSAFGGEGNILGSLFGANSRAQAEIQIMTSRAVIDPVIREMNLDLVVKGAPRGAVEISQLTVPASWYGKKMTLRSLGHGSYVLSGPDGAKVLEGEQGQTARADSGKVAINLGKLDLAGGKSVILVRQPVQRAFEMISSRVNAVELGHNTGIVQVSFLGTNPVHARNVLNALVDQYLNQNVTAYSAQARRSLRFVNRQLPDLKKQMNRAEEKLTDYQVSHNTVNVEEQARAMLNEFSALEGELTQLQLAEVALGQQYTSKYPAYAALEQQKESVNKRLKALQDRLNGLPKDEQGYVRLKRDAEVYTKLYTTLLAKAQDLRVAAEGSVGSARIVDDAVTPLRPVRPNKRLIVMLGFMLGLGLGVAAAFLRRALSSGMTDPVEIEQRFGVPMYAVVPHSSMEEKLSKRRKGGAVSTPHLLAFIADEEPTIEALRSLRTSLDFVLKNAKNRVVGLAGPMPGIGKSFVSANLAYLAATTGSKVLLIDGDMRRGHLHRHMGQPDAPGLAELLGGEVSAENCIRRNLFDSTLDFIPSGKYPKNPAELLIKGGIGDVLGRLEESYDLVLIDLPPILSVVDPIIAMRATGVNLLILRAGKHAAQEITYSLTRLRQNDIPVTGFLLNNLTRSKGPSMYAYHAEYYRAKGSK